MSRSEFGKILASLRKDLGLTQEGLAERSGIPLPVISQVERGVKQQLDPELLVQLADSLDLSTFERRQFFLASTGVELQKMVRPGLPRAVSDAADPEKELAKLKSVGEQLRIPAFVVDPYYDFILANRSVMALFQVNDEMMAAQVGIPHAYNAIHVTFGSSPLSRRIMEWNWDKFAFNTMRGFRELSLRYRATPYFEYLMRVYRNQAEYPFFDRFWKLTASVEEDKEANWDFLEYKDKTFGDVKYMAEAVIFVTAYGELHLLQYQPLNANTVNLFADLAGRYGTEMIRVASWPEKKFPKEPRSNPSTFTRLFSSDSK